MKKILLIGIFLIVACAPQLQAGGLNESSSYDFSVSIPQGWKQLNTDKYFLITKDGPFLQYVLIQKRPIDKPFQHTRKKFDRGMLPQEAAEVIVNEITSDQSIMNVKIIENTPAIINSRDGFRVVFTFKNRDGEKFKTLYYGFMAGEYVYSIRYNAAHKHYFEKDIETFKNILNSFLLIKA